MIRCFIVLFFLNFSALYAEDLGLEGVDPSQEVVSRLTMKPLDFSTIGRGPIAERSEEEIGAYVQHIVSNPIIFPRREDRSPDSGDDEDMLYSDRSSRGLREESLLPPGAQLLEDGKGEDDEDMLFERSASCSGSELVSDEELRLLPPERGASALSLASGEQTLQERQNGTQRPGCSTPAPRPSRSKVVVSLASHNPFILGLLDETTRKYCKGERLEPAALLPNRNIPHPNPGSLTEVST